MDSTDNFSQKKKKDLVAIAALFGFLSEEKANRMSKQDLMVFLQDRERQSKIPPEAMNIAEAKNEGKQAPLTEPAPVPEAGADVQPLDGAESAEDSAESVPERAPQSAAQKSAESKTERPVKSTKSAKRPLAPGKEPAEPGDKRTESKKDPTVPGKKPADQEKREDQKSRKKKKPSAAPKSLADVESAAVPDAEAAVPAKNEVLEVLPSRNAASDTESFQNVVSDSVPAAIAPVPAAEVRADTSDEAIPGEGEKSSQKSGGKSGRSRGRGRSKKPAKAVADMPESPTAPFDSIAIEEMIPLANEDRELPETITEEVSVREGAEIIVDTEAGVSGESSEGSAARESVVQAGESSIQKPAREGKQGRRHRSVIIKPKEEEGSESIETAEAAAPVREKHEKRTPAPQKEAAESAAEREASQAEESEAGPAEEQGEGRHVKTFRPKEQPPQEMHTGVLEIMSEGYGFLRKENYLQGQNDIYVPAQYIRRFGLRLGDHITGPCRPKRDSDRYQALQYIKEVNGLPPEKMLRRPHFDRLTPIYPDEKYILETRKDELSTRIIDLIAPIGKGQRGMIVSPPKAGKTILLQKIANAISINKPEAKLIVLLIDERPEEVTDMQRSIKGEVAYSTFDKTPENHVKIAELVLERAMRLVELEQDVVILLDSITRLARAYNLTINPTGRTLSGGLDPGALYGPKRFFGAARNIEGGGSLTIIATSLVETGSRMDEVIFEEFKGTGNMEVCLDRKLSEKRIFPAIDIIKSGTRREELLLSGDELDAVWTIRKAFSQLDTAAVTEMIISLLMKTNSNNQFVQSIKVSFNDKAVFEAMRGSAGGSRGNTGGK